MGATPPAGGVNESAQVLRHWPGRFPIPFHIIAHRGASAYAPENTIASFQLALELGAFEVELDVKLSSDDVVMLFHDSSLDTKTDDEGIVRDHTAARLQEMEIGSWFDRSHPEVTREFSGTRLNTLAELFDRLGSQLYYHIEFKSADPGLARHTLAVIDRAGLRDRVRFTSFLFEQLERSMALAPEIPHTFLIRKSRRLQRELGIDSAGYAETQDELPLIAFQQQQIERAASTGFDQVGLRASNLSREIVSYAHAKGLTVRAWGIKRDADMMMAIDMGASGMTTNWPDRLIREWIRETGAAPEASRGGTQE